MLIKVKIFPGIKKEEVTEKNEGVFEVKVKEKAEQGKANNRLIELLSRHFQISESQVKIISGSKKRNKTVSIKI
ncbi:MAG: DUF167 domain-containing protein [Parcubacteria group bacterium]|nr:DUF167 domain-containing protein [Parcubacteria group bacterium]MCR4342378.1 DUF167 domain-containing protein [Patescibacteria group bacterium]